MTECRAVIAQNQSANRPTQHIEINRFFERRATRSFRTKPREHLVGNAIFADRVLVTAQSTEFPLYEISIHRIGGRPQAGMTFGRFAVEETQTPQRLLDLFSGASKCRCLLRQDLELDRLEPPDPDMLSGQRRLIAPSSGAPGLSAMAGTPACAT